MAKTPAVKRHILATVPASDAASSEDKFGNQASESEKAEEASSSSPSRFAGGGRLYVDLGHSPIPSPFTGMKTRHPPHQHTPSKLASSAIEGQAADCEPTALFDLLSGGKAPSIKVVVDDWLRDWQEDKTAACLDLVNLVLRAAAVPPARHWDDDDPAAVISALQDDVQQHTREYAMANKRFRSLFEELWYKLSLDVVSAIEPSSTIEGGLLSWLVCMSSSSYRPLRLTATSAALRFASGCAKATGQHKKQLNRRRKNEALAARIAYLERLIQSIFDGVFVQRYRDVDHGIRERCLIELITWIESLADVFLDNSYLRYLGWSLSDKQARVRKLAASSIRVLVKNAAWRVSLGSFIDRFTPRLVEMACRDVDDGTRHASMQTLQSLFESEMLDDVDFVNDVIRRADWDTLAHGSTMLLRGCILKTLVDRQDNSPFSSGLLLAKLLDHIQENYSSDEQLVAVERIGALLAPSLLPLLGEWSSVVSFVRARLAFAARSEDGLSDPRMGAVRAGYGLDSTVAIASQLVTSAHSAPSLCLYRKLASAAKKTAQNAFLAGVVAEAGLGPDESDEAAKLLLESQDLSSSTGVIEELFVNCPFASTALLLMQAWARIDDAFVVSASQSKCMRELTTRLQAAVNDPSMLLSAIPLAVLSRDVFFEHNTAFIDGILESIFMNSGASPSEDPILAECWNSLLLCLVHDCIWRLKRAMTLDEADHDLADRRARLLRWCFCAERLADYRRNPTKVRWDLAFTAAGICVDLACLSMHDVAQAPGWKTSIDCKSLFELLQFDRAYGDVKVMTMACKLVVKLGIVDGMHHILRAYHQSCEALIRVAWQHCKPLISSVDAVVQLAIGDMRDSDRLNGIMRLVFGDICDYATICKTLIQAAINADDDTIIGKLVVHLVLPKLDADQREQLSIWLDSGVSFGAFKGGPAFTLLVKTLRRKPANRAKKAKDAAPADGASSGVATSEADVRDDKLDVRQDPYKVVTDRHTQNDPIPDNDDKSTFLAARSKRGVDREQQDDFLGSDAGNPFQQNNPFQLTEGGAAAGGMSQVVSDREEESENISANNGKNSKAAKKDAQKVEEGNAARRSKRSRRQHILL